MLHALALRLELKCLLQHSDDKMGLRPFLFATGDLYSRPVATTLDIL